MYTSRRYDNFSVKLCFWFKRLLIGFSLVHPPQTTTRFLHMKKLIIYSHQLLYSNTGSFRQNFNRLYHVNKLDNVI